MPIAFDTAVNGSDLSFSASISWSHTCTGSDRFILVGGWGSTGSFDLGATLNGAAMTLAGSVQPVGDRWLGLFWGIPSSGSNAVVMTSAGVMSGASVSYAGVDAAGPTAVQTDARNGVTDGISPVVSIATGVAGQWLVGMSKDGVYTTNQINFTLVSSGRSTFGDSAGSVGAAGTYTQRLGNAGGGVSGYGLVSVALAPATGGGGGGGNPWYAYAQQRIQTSLGRAWRKPGLLWTPDYAFGKVAA